MKKDGSEKRTTVEKGRRKQLTVLCSEGIRQRFLRGMITHDLVQRGLDFDSSYAIANRVREHLLDDEEVTTGEIRDLILSELEAELGPDVPMHLTTTARAGSTLTVLSQGEREPFSRGLLARSVQAAGLDLDRAYELVTRIEKSLLEEEITALPREDIALRVGSALETAESPEAAERYWLVRRLNHLPRPIVIYVGGASGTGKSSLSLELAPLLRVYRINSTDTIRQMMRMVFSPQILPALHRSSFEPAAASEFAGGDLMGEELAEAGVDQRVAANFEEQAARVTVGVRAVVERAIAEHMNILVEGVHLFPPLVPFPDLEGAAYQVLLMLGSTDVETHRARFLRRARVGGRRAERYLEHFPEIRKIQEFLLQQAEAHDVALIDTSRGDPTVAKTLGVVTDLLKKQVPGRATGAVGSEPVAPTLLLIIDGLADRPVRALGGRTPLAAAQTPTLDRLAAEGQCGLADPIAPGVVPDTASGSLALFGQSPNALSRGPVEALGAGLKLGAGDVALRANFATLNEEGIVIDRRAGRIRKDTKTLAKALDRIPLPGFLSDEAEVRVRPATEHRLAIVIRGQGLSSAIQGSDPGEGTDRTAPQTPEPRDPDDTAAVYTARILAIFEQEARRILRKHPINRERKKEGKLPANTLLTRGAGRLHHLVSLENAGRPVRIGCVSGDSTLLGLASWLGAATFTDTQMTANLDTDLEHKFKAVEQAFEHNDLVILHLKGADIAAHDLRPDLKLQFIENVDVSLGRFLERWPKGGLRIAVSGDHATLSESGMHASDPLPVLIWGSGLDRDDVTAFDEQSVAIGALQRFPLQLLMGRLFDLT